MNQLASLQRVVCYPFPPHDPRCLLLFDSVAGTFERTLAHLNDLNQPVEQVRGAARLKLLELGHTSASTDLRLEVGCRDRSLWLRASNN